LAEIERVVEVVTVEGLINLAADPSASPGVRSRVEARLEALREVLEATSSGGRVEAAQRAALSDRIDQYQAMPAPPMEPPPVAAEPPPGDPIG
jgi:hypothetical protein